MSVGTKQKQLRHPTPGLGPRGCQRALWRGRPVRSKAAAERLLREAAASLIARINNLSRLVSASNRQTSDVVFRRQRRRHQRLPLEATIEDVNPHQGRKAPKPWDTGTFSRAKLAGSDKPPSPSPPPPPPAHYSLGRHRLSSLPRPSNSRRFSFCSRP